ncbi:MAG: YjbE family putative metal transport protein [Hyphomicrobiaceae bacterium]|nr:YjbE family putative metal transport protein [Hyphomicrobiaceae bacterium]
MIDPIIEWFTLNWFALANVIMIDVVLAGDNAIIVGLAAAQVAPHLRARVIFWGIAGAVVLRIAFAGVATQLLQIVGLTLAGGLLLLWVCWKMYRQIHAHSGQVQAHSLGAAATTAGTAGAAREMSFWAALGQIIIADVSMSLDNVLAVAGAAKGSPLVLVIGLAVAVVLMAVASHYIAGLLSRYPAITWVGLVIIVFVALDMIYDGSHEVACHAYTIGCQTDLWQWAKSSVVPGWGLPWR